MPSLLAEHAEEQEEEEAQRVGKRLLFARHQWQFTSMATPALSASNL